MKESEEQGYWTEERKEAIMAPHRRIYPSRISETNSDDDYGRRPMETAKNKSDNYESKLSKLMGIPLCLVMIISIPFMVVRTLIERIRGFFDTQKDTREEMQL